LTISVEALKDNRLIVWDLEESNKLYLKGFYGKPLGILKPKKDFQVPLVLDPIEGVYLLEKEIIEVYSSNDKKIITLKELKKRSKKTLNNFFDKYKVYKDLREKGLIVTPGVKYGSDFAVYEHGPGIDHAPYIIQILRNNVITAEQIVRSGRLATTVRKTFILAIVEKEKINYVEFKWWKP
jgi:tRNA-intron endonuclease